MKELLWVGFGGFLGSIGRYGIFILTSKYLGEKTYWSILLINLIGSFLIGLLGGGFLRLNEHQSLFLITGFCGGFTTFSTFSMDGLKLLKNGLYIHFFLYASISILGGLLVCLTGFYLANRN